MAPGGDQKILGINAVRSALTNDPANVTLLELSGERGDKRAKELETLARNGGVAVVRVGRRELDQHGRGHQGAVAHYRSAEPLTEAALLTELAELENPLVLLLDHLEDPRNFGACLRSAAAAEADAVIYPKDRAVGLTPAARKTAAGGADLLRLAQVVNLNRTVDALKDAGLWVVGSAADAPQTLYEIDLRGPTVLVLGSEGKGMKRLLRERCDHLARIPISPQMESLNVSVAAALMLFEARRQRDSGYPHS
ncbi:MAG: 23S rRNA (guanosine(2251)-2'-O)-methyltransferase RlmB [Pseudomonadota bacterium]